PVFAGCQVQPKPPSIHGNDVEGLSATVQGRRCGDPVGTDKGPLIGAATGKHARGKGTAPHQAPIGSIQSVDAVGAPRHANQSLSPLGSQDARGHYWSRLRMTEPWFILQLPLPLQFQSCYVLLCQSRLFP